MKIALVTDAWVPQVNGVVTTLVELVRHLTADGHDVLVIEPRQFRTRPCPGYAGIDLAVSPGEEVARRLDGFQPDAVHLATEGPLGWAARRHCLRRGWAFTTAFHTKFPEIVNAAIKVPVSWGY
ncbi:MAG TPA: glycosyltransferase, partial [Ramlibacter sp.]